MSTLSTMRDIALPTATPTRVPVAPSTGTPVAPPIPVTPPAVMPATAAPTRTPIVPVTAAPTRSPTRLPVPATPLAAAPGTFRRDQPRWVRDDHDHDGFERCHRLHCHSGQGGDGHQNDRWNVDFDLDQDLDLVPSRPLTSVENTTHAPHLSSRRMGRRRGLFDQRCLHQDAPP